MKREVVHCEFCKAAMDVEECELATYRTVIDRKEYTFCCRNCATRYQESKKKK